MKIRSQHLPGFADAAIGADAGGVGGAVVPSSFYCASSSAVAEDHTSSFVAPTNSVSTSSVQVGNKENSFDECNRSIIQKGTGNDNVVAAAIHNTAFSSTKKLTTNSAIAVSKCLDEDENVHTNTERMEIVENGVKNAHGDGTVQNSYAGVDVKNFASVYDDTSEEVNYNLLKDDTIDVEEEGVTSANRNALVPRDSRGKTNKQSSDVLVQHRLGEKNVNHGTDTFLLTNNLPQSMIATAKSQEGGLLLQPGTQVELCLMAEKGMNGLVGNILCFNENSQRYTVKLGNKKGKTMFLKPCNVKAMTINKEGQAKKLHVTTPPPAPVLSSTYSRNSHGRIGSSSLQRQRAQSSSSNSSSNQRGRFNQNVKTQWMISFLVAVIMLFAYFSLKSGNHSSISTAIAESPSSSPSVHDVDMLQDYHHTYSHNYTDGRLSYNANWRKYVGIIIFIYLSNIAWNWGTSPARGFRVHNNGFLRRDDSRGEFRWQNVLWRMSTCSFWDIAGISGLILWLLKVEVDSILGAIAVFWFIWQLDHGSLYMRV